MSRAPIIRDNNMLKQEVELLDSLSDMKEANSIMKNETDAGMYSGFE